VGETSGKVDYLFLYLRHGGLDRTGMYAMWWKAKKRFAPYRGPIVSVAGQESRGGVSRENAVFGFVPESSDAPAGRNEDRFDI